MSFSLRNVGLLLLGLPPTATDKRFATELHGNSSAAANFARLRTMMDRVGDGDALSLYARNGSGAFDVAEWIDRGKMPDGSSDPLYAIKSDATRKNHYTTLVMLSTPGKCCDALAAAVSPDAKDYFKKRLAEVAKIARERDGSVESYATGGGEESATWEEITHAYSDPDRLSLLGPEDRLIVDFWVMCGPGFPPQRQDFSNVVISRSRASRAVPGQSYLFFRDDAAFVSIATREGISVKRDLPPELSRSIKKHLDQHGWRKWLFQSRSGKPRPLKPNTYGQQVQAAFHRLLFKRLGVNALTRAYARRHLPEQSDT